MKFEITTIITESYIVTAKNAQKAKKLIINGKYDAIIKVTAPEIIKVKSIKTLKDMDALHKETL